jgi:pSer/pThr/pTyr-binding forkhead associated (FHA) protein
VADDTRTVSKTHARLERQGENWMVIDLDSTNGVILVDDDGDEIDATPGVPERLTERFLLGDAPLRMLREGS